MVFFPEFFQKFKVNEGLKFSSLELNDFTRDSRVHKQAISLSCAG